MRRRVLWILVVTGAIVLALLLTLPYARAAAFILDISGSTHWSRSILPARTYAVTTRDLEIPTRHGTVAARLAEPATTVSHSVIVFPGVHSGGVDEPRLALFSQRLAATGVRVLTVPLPGLREFRITPDSTDVIEDAVLWMTADRTLAPTGRVGIAGVSFAGGLALVAAGRPSLVDKVDLVVSIGGHANLPRVMEYLCTGRLPDGKVRPPHDYGVAIILMGAVERLVPKDQVEPLRRAVRTFLIASSDTSSDQGRADQEFADARAQAAALAEPAHTFADWVNDRNTAALGKVLLPLVDELGGAPALSPDRSPVTHAPVFLLHGELDNVIPSTETPHLANYLEKSGNTHVRSLLTPLLSHAHLQEQSSLADKYQLISFWSAVLSAVR